MLPLDYSALDNLLECHNPSPTSPTPQNATDKNETGQRNRRFRMGFKVRLILLMSNSKMTLRFVTIMSGIKHRYARE